MYIERAIKLLELEKYSIILKLERPELFKMAAQPENFNFKTQFTQFDIVELALSLKLTEKIKKKMVTMPIL